MDTVNHHDGATVLLIYNNVRVKRIRTHIGWLWCSVLLMLLTGCSSSDDTGEQQPATLTVYVYSPERPMLIRSDVGHVNTIANEGKITKLQIWIFNHATGTLVGYLAPTDFTQLTMSEGAAYQVQVDDDFVSSKPAVDVYVLANVTSDNSGCAFDGSTTRTQLDEAQLTSGYFGLESLTKDVPDDGLPMAGVLSDQPVVGDAPVLRVGTLSNIATVSLRRVVSKLRFVFANKEGAEDLYISNIQLDASMIPTTEKLFAPSYPAAAYHPSATDLWSSAEKVATVPDPTEYIYSDQEAQVYENLIDQSALTMTDPFYLRESDKRLSGRITYRVGTNPVQYSRFEMDVAGDFLRNHTWIIYVYYTGGGYLLMSTLYVKNWTNKDEEHAVYNW